MKISLNKTISSIFIVIFITVAFLTYRNLTLKSHFYFMDFNL